MTPSISAPTRRRAVFAVIVAVMVVSAEQVSAQEAQTVRDADNARVVLAVVIGLIALGVMLAVVTVWFWRTTRPEDPILLRLEILGRRRVRRLEPDERRRLLDGKASVADQPVP